MKTQNHRSVGRPPGRWSDDTVKRDGLLPIERSRGMIEPKDDDNFDFDFEIRYFIWS